MYIYVYSISCAGYVAICIYSYVLLISFTAGMVDKECSRQTDPTSQPLALNSVLVRLKNHSAYYVYTLLALALDVM